MCVCVTSYTPLDHATGVGYVAGHAGHYGCRRRRLAKGRQVVLLVIETTGAMHPDAIGMLYAWHAEARAEGCIDRTVYGASRTATTSFFMHHLRLISLAAVIGAALPVAVWAKARKSHLRRPACWPVASSHVSAPPGDTLACERRCTVWCCFELLTFTHTDTHRP